MQALSCSEVLRCGYGVDLVALAAAALDATANAVCSASQLVGSYETFAAAYLVGTTLAYALVMKPLFGGAAEVGARRLLLANVLFLFGFFVVRFAFYMIHMTSGISL